MTNAASAQRYIGLRAVDQQGNKIGSVGRVFMDETTGQPSWVKVNSGLPGSRDDVVPLHGSRIDGNDLVIPFDKDVLKESPKITDASHLDRDEEQSLYDYYLSIMAATRIALGRRPTGRTHTDNAMPTSTMSETRT